MRLTACLLLLILCAACVPTDPAGLEAQAAGMRQQTAEAVGMLSLAAQYTQAARDADATATLAVATMQVSQARATMEMAAAERAANAQAIDNARASATLAAERTEIAAAPIRAAATATQAAAEQFHRESMRTGMGLAGMLLLVFATGAVCILIWTFAAALVSRIQAWADERKTMAFKARFLETSQGLKLLDAQTGAALSVSDPAAEAVVDGELHDPQPTEVSGATTAERKPQPTLGELEIFVLRAIRVAGVRATHIPGHREMRESGATWSLRMERLEALRMIPRRAHGKRSDLFHGHTLGMLLATVREYEQGAPPSPTDV